MIRASNVTLDLCGFGLVGVAGSLHGIEVPVAQANLAISGGTVRDWGGAGLNGALAVNCQLKNLRAFNNGANGLHVDQGSTVVNCAARSNGLSGIVAGNASTVRDCAARNNGQDGVQAGAGSLLAHCTGRDNVDDGIQAGDGSTLTACAGSTVRGCAARANGGDGVAVTNGCQVVGNTCEGNSAGAGVRASGTNNRIDSNHVVNNGAGILVSSSGNVIVRNSGSDNAPNYSIANGNDVGPIGTAATATSPWSNISF